MDRWKIRRDVRTGRFLTAVVAFGVIFHLTLGCSGPAGGADVDELEARIDAFFQAMEEGASADVAALFAEDGIMHVAGMPEIHGRTAIEGFYSNLFGFLESSSALPASVRVATDGSMAFVAGSTTNAFRGPEGPVEYAGKFLLVWVRDDGGWRIGAYSVSSDQADGAGG